MFNQHVVGWADGENNMHNTHLDGLLKSVIFAVFEGHLQAGQCGTKRQQQEKLAQCVNPCPPQRQPPQTLLRIPSALSMAGPKDNRTSQGWWLQLWQASSMLVDYQMPECLTMHTHINSKQNPSAQCWGQRISPP